MYKVSIVKELFNRIHKENILYCHWKSAAHIGTELGGGTELSLLIERGHSQRLKKIVLDLNFKEFKLKHSKNPFNTLDFFGVDKETGILIHISIYFQLYLEGTIRNRYRVPWETFILTNRIYNKQHHMYVCDPCIDFILLLVNTSISVRNRDYLKNYPLEKVLVNYEAYKKQINKDDLISFTTKLFYTSVKVQKYISSMYTTTPVLKQFVQLKRLLIKELIVFEHNNQKKFNVVHYINKKTKHYSTKGLPVDGGRLIILMGASGAGKSTQVASVSKWLKDKIGVVPIYFGSGDGTSSLLRLPFKMIQGVIIKRNKHRKDIKSDSDGRKKGIFKRHARVVWALILSYEKRKKLKKAHNVRMQGGIVIGDRYPQSQVIGLNDGPLLNHWLSSKNTILKKVAKWESYPYRLAEAFPPDLVIKLEIDLSMAMERRKEMTKEKLEKRIEAVRSFEYPTSEVVFINAHDDIDTVTTNVRNSLWRSL